MNEPAEPIKSDAPVSLRTLYQLHQGKVSIKWEHYFGEYDRIFAPQRKRSVRLLEIGIQNGGSLEIWAKYFENGEMFIGCDINPLCSLLAYEDRRILIIAGDATRDATRDEIKRLACPLDIIIDDGSHLSGDVLKSFLQYFPMLSEDGIYVIEDLQAGYWQEYEGGLYYPYSSVSFFKRLADVINSDYWMTGKTLNQYLEKLFGHYGIEADADSLRHVVSVEFTRSMCFIRKAPAENKISDHCLVAGSEEAVASGHTGSNFQITYPDQSDNPWSNPDYAPDKFYDAHHRRVGQMEQSLCECNCEMERLNKEITTLKSIIDAMQNSQSWRLTSPLRYLKRIFLKGGKRKSDGLAQG